MRDQQSRRATVLGSERLSFIGIGYPRLAARYVFHRKVRSVTTITKGYQVLGMVIDLCQQCIDRHPFPICVQFGPLRHTMDVRSHCLMRQGTKFVPGPMLPLMGPLKYRKIPGCERSVGCRPCRKYGKRLLKILPGREPCAEITLSTTASEPGREGSLTHFCPPSHPVVDYLVFVEIFLGHIILRHFARSDFLRFIVSSFDSVDYLGLERVAFFDKFADAFRIRTGRSGQSLQISG